MLADADRKLVKVSPKVVGASGWTELVAAGVAVVRGDTGRAAELLRSAIAGLDEAEMALYAAVARRHYGELLGGDEGRSLVEASEAYMTAEGILDPKRICSTLIPGFD